MRDSRDGVVPSDCPTCGRHCDAATMMFGDDSPVAGDITVCLYCGSLAIFTDDGQRLPTDVERAQLLEDPDVIKVIAAVRLDGPSMRP